MKKRVLLVAFLCFSFASVYATLNWDIQNGVNYITEGDEYNEIWVNNSAELNILNGNINRVNCADFSTTNIYGWENSEPIPSNLSLHLVVGGNSVVNIFQGNTNGQLNAYDNSIINLYGTNFDFNRSYLTGTWADGADFSFYMRGQFELPSNIVFHEIPEPATLALLGLGGLLIRKRKQ